MYLYVALDFPRNLYFLVMDICALPVVAAYSQDSPQNTRVSSGFAKLASVYLNTCTGHPTLFYLEGNPMEKGKGFMGFWLGFPLLESIIYCWTAPPVPL